MNGVRGVLMCFGHCNGVWPCYLEELIRSSKQISYLDPKFEHITPYRLCDALPIFSQPFATFFEARIRPDTPVSLGADY